MDTVREGAPKTPMLRQYWEIKSRHLDAILFFRLGDFYEMFFEDAVEASRILNITLTSRNKGEETPVPLCGIPCHSYEPYVAKLLAAGRKVAICEQVEDPSKAKGVLKREVVRVVTPGMVLDEGVLDSSKPNYLVSLYGDHSFGFAILDISTAEFRLGVVKSFEALEEELNKLDPSEILIPQSWEGEREGGRLRENFPHALLFPLVDKEFDPLKVSHLEGARKLPALANEGLKAAGALWGYVCHAQRGNPPHVTALEYHETERFLILDESARKNLELIKTQDHEKKGSLLNLLDETATPMGARRLRHWLLYPLLDCGEIAAREKAIQTLIDESALQKTLDENLEKIRDLERLVGRIAFQTANARDLISLAYSLKVFPALQETFQSGRGLLGEGVEDLEGFEPLSQNILKTLSEEPPLALKEGGLIRDGFHPELDELRSITGKGKEFIARLEKEERERTGISSLKVRFNKVFGYYIEVTHTHRDKIPDDYIRKQTLINSERYITPKLKEYEEKVLGAEERMRQLEYELFLSLREEAAKWGRKIQKGADRIALLDSLYSLAKVASKRRWVCPKVIEEGGIEITEGRHPIVEELSGERFVPNDLCLDSGENRFLIITGPNMAGKSTIMRQTALIVILAQMGSFVPAVSASIGLIDRIFTRVGAYDRLARGESTFMVEMVEAARILKEATEKSLVIIDEIGRGTSTYDGVAIAWAVAEYLNNQIKAKTLFATHYHELIDLPKSSPGMKNFNIAVKEWNGQIIFLRKLLPGGTSRSYGVEVAKLAGLPPPVIARGKEILSRWEKFSSRRDKSFSRQISLFDSGKEEEPDPEIKTALKELKELDPNRLTPLQALEFLTYLKSKV